MGVNGETVSEKADLNLGNNHEFEGESFPTVLWLQIGVLARLAERGDPVPLCLEGWINDFGKNQAAISTV